MTFVRLVALGLFAIVWFGVASKAALADERNDVHVLIVPTVDGVIARFTLERAVDTFVLAYESDEIRDKTWKLSSPDLTREGSTIASANGATFSSFEIEIAPFNEPTSATYPCLFRVGEDGLGLYAGYFVADEAQYATTLEIRPIDDQIVLGFPLGGNTWRVDQAFHKNAGHRYVYVGPRAYLSESRYARFVTSPSTPPPVTRRIRENVDGAIGFYTRELARPLAAKPLIIVAENFDYEHPGAQGDTTLGPAVALRLFGRQWTSFDPKSDRLDHLTAHEVAHLWNSSGTYRAAKGSPAWMWEGGAEILALEARIAVMKRLTPLGGRQHIEAALNTCLPSLFDHPMTAPRSGATYACGETLYWIADAAETKRSPGRGDIFAIWRRMFDHADSNGGLYTLPDFLTFAATSKDAGRALSLFLSDTGGERWQTLPDVLKPLGIELAKEPTPHDANTLRHIAMWHVLNMVCTGSRGMRRETDYLKLDTGDRCGPLSGDPEVDTLNDRNLFTDMPAAYAAAQTACATGGDIVLTRTGKPGTRPVPCTKPLPDAPPRFRILRTP